MSVVREARTSLNRGARAFLPKPFELETLETMLASLL
jgi:hypothetical protein